MFGFSFATISFFIACPKEPLHWHLTTPSVSLSCPAHRGTSATATAPRKQILLHSSGELHRCVVCGLPQRVRLGELKCPPTPSTESVWDYWRNCLQSPFS